MANKRQTITTKLDADSKGLNDALSTAQQGLKKTAQEAQRTGKELQGALQVPKGTSTGLDNLGKSATTAGKSLQNLKAPGGAASWGAWGNTATMALTAVVTGATILTKHFNELSNSAQALGITAEGLQRLDNAARDTGTSSEGLHSAYSKFISTLASAQKGSTKAQKALAQLGLTAKDLSEGGEKAFLKAARALGEIEDATARDAAAMAVFGNSTQATQKALQQCVTTGQSMSGIVTDKEVEQFSRLAKQVDRLTDSLWNAAGILASKPAGWLADLIQFTGGDNMQDASATNGDEIAEMEAWNQQYGADAVAARRRRELRRRQAGAEYAARFEPGEEERLEELQRASRQEEARKAALEEMRRASMTPQQREWEDYQKNRASAISKKRAETGWNQSQAEAWARTVFDPQNAPNVAGNQGFTPQNIPSSGFASPVAVASSGVGLDTILGAILSLRANTYIVK